MLLCCVRQIYVVFFFSSRRRHTRYIGDWSSDVCSSDLGFAEVLGDRVIVLADRAERAEEIDVPRAQAALERAQKRLATPKIGRASCREREQSSVDADSSVTQATNRGAHVQGARSSGRPQ